MKSRHAYLKILLTATVCLFTAGLYAAEEGMEEAVMAEEEEMAAEEGLEEEGMLEEEAEELPPLYTSEIELGVGYSSEDSFWFGQYNGLEDEGAFAIGNISLRKHSVIGDDDNDYWELSGSNLGLDPRSLYGEYSHDGTYGNYSQDRAYSLFIMYDQIQRNQLDDAQTPFAGAGTANQTLPAGYANPGSGTAGIVFGGTLHQVDVETERETLGGGFSLMPADGWKIAGKYHHQSKEGTDTTGISTSAFTNAFIGIMPIDYEFDEFDLSIARVGKKGHFELGYHLSLFENDTHGIMFENPFSNGASVPLRQIEQIGQAPDNTAHAVRFAGGYNLGQTTLATANLSYQRMSQDDTFLPYTVNTSFLPLPFAELPRNSLDGVINNWFANLTLTGQPTPKLNLTGRYTFDYRDSDTPANTYQYIRTDAAAQQDVDTSRARVNPVYDFERHKAGLDGSYRLMPHATLSAGYEFDYVTRDNTEVEHTSEHTGNVKLTGSPTDRTHGWLKYLHAEKDGSTYDNTVPFFTGFSPEHVADVIVNDCGDPLGGPYDLTCPDYYENNSYMRKYYLADRSRDQVAGNLSFFPNDKFTVGVSGRYTTDDFDDTKIGLTDRDIASATLDVSYIPRENLTTYAYYTHDYINNDQVGCEACTPELGAPIPVTNRWEVSNVDHVNTVGAGLEWLNVIENKLDLTLDFAYTKANTEVEPIVSATFVDPGILPFPDIETTIYSLNLRGDYRLNKQTRLRFMYMYEHFKNVDWAFDNVNPTTIDVILATGEDSPDYNAHVFGLSLIYDF